VKCAKTGQGERSTVVMCKVEIRSRRVNRRKGTGQRAGVDLAIV